MTQTIDKYAVIWTNYNAKVPEQFQLQSEIDADAKGEVTVMQNDPMAVVVDVNDAAVTAIKVICKKIGD